MPIYEYRCGDCRRKVSIFWRSLSAVDESKARCAYCGGAKLNRLVSKVRVIRGGKAGGGGGGGEDSGGAPGAGEDMPPELAGLDENDPRSLGHFLRKMASETGEDMGPEFEEVVGRLEKGEDPEKIEQSMGDLLGDESGGGMDGMGGMGGMDDDMGYGGAPPAPPAEEKEAGAVEKQADKPASRTVAVDAKTKRAASSKPKPAAKPAGKRAAKGHG
jgi:putative FmdB family regulatory protein